MNEAHTGYRLDCLEFYNWGTFDDRTSRVVPACQSSLMTGANGSGKTTIVDALLTLLVPNQKRFYNQSSGAEQKKDRSEESYVLGEIGKTREDEDLEAKKKYIRPDKATTVSFLLGCFHNPETGCYVTLVQARWFSATELKRTFIVSPHQLSIDKDIMPFDKHGDWRKRLKKAFARTEITDSFAQYSQEFIRLFNMRSDKALTLFNQTVGIKVLGNLNEFIRVHMLEDGLQEEEFQKLRSNYLDLLETYNNLQKAEEQIRLLGPVVEGCNELAALKESQQLLENIKNAVPFYFSEQEMTILKELVSDTQGRRRQQEELIARKEAEKKRKEEELKALQAALEKNKANEAIKAMEGQIANLREASIRKEDKAGKYREVTDKLGYAPVERLETFIANKQLAENELVDISHKLEENREIHISKAVILQTIDEKIRSLEIELTSLRGRKNRIPLPNIELRQRMLDVLELEADEIPFVGELIRVRENEKSWESAIERLIRPFALRMLVPEKHLRAVNSYIHQTHLRGKIVYDKVRSGLQFKEGYRDIDVITLRDKIEIKENQPLFEPWLEQELAEHLNYTCVETEQEFEQARKALLISGLSKNRERHEKDDRPNMVSQDRFILGWDNKEQIRLLEKALSEQLDLRAQIDKQLKQLGQDAINLGKQRELLQKLLYFTDYQELNWQDDKAEIKNLKEKQERLLKDSGLKELTDQRNEAGLAVHSLNEIVKEEVKKVGQLEERIKAFQKDITDLDLSLRQENMTTAQNYYEFIPPYIREVQTSDQLKKVREERKKTEQAVEDDLVRKRKEEGKTESKIIQAMAAFTSPAEDIRQKFPDWSKDTVNLSANTHYADDFRELFDRITKEDLPKYKEDFKEYMKDSVTSRITSFKTGLDNRQEEIEEHILELNRSLHKIDFNVNPHTYIQLRSKPAKDLEIRNFKRELSDCIVPAADIALAKDDDWMETAFLNIHNLIERLHNDREKRRKLIDVRNWMDFEAEEFLRENNKRRKTLDSSDSLSGGEKAQFTYTVLGAAIAFQFGISDSGPKRDSFRFIAVDEAFSKLDPEKSHYLMALCKQLHLQILVVTPLDKIYVAEEYISSCHFVEKLSTERSRVHNLTMPQYHEQKRVWQAKTLAN
nr:SbcC/MukB-like Walker B domain-containing protein [uncultured Chitinophaga sp.]